MSTLEVNRARRYRPYVSSRAAAARIFAMVEDPFVPAPSSPMPTLSRRDQAVFDRIMATCVPTPVPAEAVDVHSKSVQPPPPRKPRRT